MPSPTSTRSPSSSTARFRRQQTPARGRFGTMPGRSATPHVHRPSMPAMPARRRKPQSRMSKMMSSIRSAIPGIGSSKKSRGKASTGKRAGAMALVAGSVGLAMKNRDRLMGMVRGEQHGHAHDHAHDHAMAPPPGPGMPPSAGAPGATPPPPPTIP